MEQNNHEWYSPKGIYDWYAPNFPTEAPKAENVREEQAQPRASEAPQHAAPAPKIRKKHTGMKVTMIIICVLVLIAGSAIAFSDGIGFGGIDFDYSISLPGFSASSGDDEETPGGNEVPALPEAPADEDDEGRIPDSFFGNIIPNIIPDSGADDGMPDDFRDFFDGYYTMEESIAPSNIPIGGVGGDVSIVLDSSDRLEELTLQQLYNRCSPSVVGVMAQMGTSGSYGWGTGVIIDSSGYIVTNAHVIAEATACTVVLWNGRECAALLVGSDPLSDLAVLKIEAKGLVPAEFGNSDDLSVGDEVVAIGNPLGAEFSGTLTNGIISAINRNVDYSGTNLTLIQTNAALNEGNSGGPLINMYGQVIGITNMKMVNNYGGATIEGIGFAIPSTTVKAVCDQLIAKGKVEGRPGIGITCGSVPQQAMDEYGLPEGLYITEVSEGSDAKAKGILPGDVLTHINGQKVLTTDDVLSIRDEHKIGDVLIFTIYRDGETFDVGVEIYDLGLLY